MPRPFRGRDAKTPAKRAVGAIIALFLVATASFAEELHPLATPDTSSPRATMQSCQDFIGRYAELIRRHYVAMEPVSAQVIDDLEGRIARCFDLSEVPKERIDDIDDETAVYLQGVLDRIALTPEQEIPDAAAVKEGKLTRWRVPGTDIVLAQVQQGPRQGEWLFSTETVSRLRDFYHSVKDLPYRPDAVVGAIGPHGGLYTYSVLFPEATIPGGWIDALPAGAMTVYLEQPVWKWLATAFVLIVGGLLFALVCRASWRKTGRRSEEEEATHWETLLPPVSGVAIALVADHLIDEVFDFTGAFDAATETSLWVVVLLCLAWAAVVLCNLLAEAIILSPRINPKSVDASLIAITGRVGGLAVALWVLVEGAENLGLSLIPIVAGLGVGGLAIALAVRPTFENLIGGFILFIDKPVRVGDRCRFGGQLGDVENIGLRSTRIRTRENTLLTIPNAEFAQMQIDNMSQREFTLYRVTLSLRYETTPEQLRFVLAKTREMLLGHPKVTPFDLRVRFRDLGEYALNIEIFAYTRTNRFSEYWAIREDLNLRIMEIVKEAGTGFAFPSQTAYLGRDAGLDAERGREAEAQVQDWRSRGHLPFPEFEEGEQTRLEDNLDYPPEGSPHHRARPDAAETEQAEAPPAPRVEPLRKVR